MHEQHEPNSAFVENLEMEINREVRRRNRYAQTPRQTFRWIPQSGGKAALAIMGLMLVSMGFGAAAVATAYQIQGKQSRDVLISGLERRADLAREALKLATEKQQNTERAVSRSLMNQENLLEARVRVAEADQQLKSIESRIEEVRITGREPVSAISAPLISGRDFVSERLQIEMSVPQAERELEQLRLQGLQNRASLGLANSLDLDVSRSQTAEVEAAVEGFEKKIEIRQMFLAHKMNAVTAELRVLEIESEQRRKTLAPQVDLARKELEGIAARVRLGLASSVDQAEAALRLQELETRLAEADLDLARVRRQLGQHQTGR